MGSGLESELVFCGPVNNVGCMRGVSKRGNDETRRIGVGDGKGREKLTLTGRSQRMYLMLKPAQPAS